MSDLDDRMPPDPWAKEGIDPWTLEQAEALVREGVTGDDPRWRAIEDGPLLDDFDVRETDSTPGGVVPSTRRPAYRRQGSRHVVGLLAGTIAILLVVALVLMMVR
ncbi:MAG: hypothetical protein OEV43_07745 [Coriobacteriia bacterium]|nr:hypothetical protein [Coriobacteriia bacterium]